MKRSTTFDLLVALLISCTSDSVIAQASSCVETQDWTYSLCYGAKVVEGAEFVENDYFPERGAIATFGGGFTPAGYSRQTNIFNEGGSLRRYLRNEYYGSGVASASLSAASTGPLKVEMQGTSNLTDWSLTAGAHTFAGEESSSEYPGFAYPTSALTLVEFRDVIVVSFPKSIDSVQVTIGVVLNGEITVGPGPGAAIESVVSARNPLAIADAITWAAFSLTDPGFYINQVQSSTFSLAGQVDAGDHWESTFLLDGNIRAWALAGRNVQATASAFLVLPQGATFETASMTLVPEPNTALLLIAGIALMLQARHRSRDR